MTTESKAHETSAPLRAKCTRRSAKTAVETTILLDQSGDWMPADELRLLLLQAQQGKQAVVLHFGGLTYLETSSLQVLLAARKSMTMQLASVGDALQQGLRSAGAEALLHAATEAA